MHKLKILPANSLRWLALGMLYGLPLVGCQTQRPDIGAQSAAFTGVENAIVFRTSAETATTMPVRELSPAQAVRLALAHDPRIQVALANVRVAEADADQARLLPNPVLSVDLRFPQSAGGVTAFESTLTADLVALLQKPGQIAAADHRLRGSAFTALTTVLDLISEVQMAYAAAWSTEQSIANADRRDKILHRLRDIAQKRLDAGDATKLDVLTLDAQIMQATLELDDLRQQRTEQRLLLARLIGQPRAAVEGNSRLGRLRPTDRCPQNPPGSIRL